MRRCCLPVNDFPMPCKRRGLLIGGLFMDPKSAQTVTTIIMLTFLLVGGEARGRVRAAVA